MNISEKIQKIVDDMPKVYDAGYVKGQESMVDESKIIEKTASAVDFLNINDVSEVPHEVEIQLTSDTITDFSNTEVTVRGKNLWDKEYALDKNNWTYLNASYSSVAIYVGKDNYVTFSYKDTLQTGLGIYVAVMTENTAADAVTSWMYHSTVSSMISNVVTIKATEDYVYLRISNIHINPYFSEFWEYIGNDLQIEINKIASEYENYKKEVYTPSSDGKLIVKSISPVMNISTNKSDINISANYHRSYGIQTAYDDFWDRYQQNGKRTGYLCAFCESGWNTETFKPKYDIKPTTAYMMFRNFNRVTGSTPIDMVELCEKQGIVFDTSKITTGTYIFQNANISRLGTISLISMSAFENIFLQCSNLITIEELDFGTTGKQIWYTVFNGCKKLANINSAKGVIGQSANLSECPLTAQSIKNIVNALSSTTSGKTITLNKTAVNTAFNIDVDDESTWGEGTEYYELRHSKDNWTFSYV